jgi:hypothetical protein
VKSHYLPSDLFPGPLQFWVSLVGSFIEWFPCCFLSIFCTSFSLIIAHTGKVIEI